MEGRDPVEESFAASGGPPAEGAAPAPGRSGVGGEGAAVLAVRLDGGVCSGRLRALLEAQGRVLIEASEGGVEEVRFGQLRELRFEEPAAAPGAGAPARPYRLHYRDGVEARGECVASRADVTALQLWVKDPDGVVRRRYVPLAVLKDYRIGPLIGRVLIERAGVPEAAVDEALERQRRAEPGAVPRLGEVLVGMGAASEEQVQRALAEKLGLAFVALADVQIDPAALGYVPAELARRYGAIPLAVEGRHLRVAMRDPTDTEALSVLGFVSGLGVEPVVAPGAEIQRAIEAHYGSRETAVALEEIGAAGDVPGEAGEAEEAARLASERPLVRLVHGMLLEAVRRGASDLHLRPGEREVELLLRIDGTLVPVRRFSKALLPAVVARLKVLGRMDIAERRLPQDGRTRLVDGGRGIDVRLSVLPTVNGESVAARILDTRAALRGLYELGLEGGDAVRLRALLARSYGLFLVTGPTGSGKSTTLYAALEEIRARGPANLITVEDPVEYRIAGVTQVQIDRGADLSFARVLRNLLRHDPDVIMVGEIRDRETARIAVESALTGHLVLSTLHTNDAAATVVRLLEMGVEDYLVAGTLLGVLAQRLVRRNCPACLAPERVEEAVRRALGVEGDEPFYRGAGCAECHGTGYRGRLAVYELLAVDAGLRTRIRAGVTAAELRAAALEAGMTALTQQALSRARARLTSLAEVYRVRLD